MRLGFLCLPVIVLGVAGCDYRPAGRLSPVESSTQANSSAIAATQGQAVTPANDRATEGRFQLVISPHLRADTFLIDTSTGRIWQMTEFSALEGKPVAWQEMTIIDDKGELGPTYEEFRKAFTKSSKDRGTARSADLQ